MKKNIFITKSKNEHGDKYDYSSVIYVNNKTKVKIGCPIHGVFEQEPRLHTSGHGCKKCANENLFSNSKKFVEKSRKIHNEINYDYTLVNYINNDTKVKIICPKHGIFEQKPRHHINGSGCPTCSNRQNIKYEYKHDVNDTNTFIKKSKNVHGDKYDYTLIKYINTKTKVKIGCTIHGLFEQTPNKHLQGRGCPICNVSKGELLITNILKNLNVNYITQKKFNNCRYKNTLPFDFYLPDYNMCIEFDGEQHFKEHKIWGQEKFFNTKRNDEIKNIYCKENNINLIRIRYDENINYKLNEIIKI